jgi:hypothetical protein
MMNLLEKCVFAMIDSAAHLMNPRKMALSACTVFYDPGGKKIRFAYVPREVPAQNAVDVLTEFVSELEEGTGSRELRDYLKAIVSYIDYNNCSLFDVINCTSYLIL